MQKRDSKSFDSGALYRPDIDDDSNGTSSLERMDRIERFERMERPERSETKIMLPTPPVRPSAITNQSENSSNAINDRNKTDTNNTGDSLSDSNKDETQSGEPNEVFDDGNTKKIYTDKLYKALTYNPCNNKFDAFILYVPFFIPWSEMLLRFCVLLR